MFNLVGEPETSDGDEEAVKEDRGSVALFIPPEMLEELRLEPGAEVEVVSEGGSIRVRRGAGSAGRPGRVRPTLHQEVRDGTEEPLAEVAVKPGVENVVFLHTVAVGAFDGSEGVRDLESLRAAVARPWGSSFGRDHFPSPFDRTAALAGSTIRRHPFVDGNKRTAMYAAAYLLEKLEYELEAEQEELEDFAVRIALGELKTEEIAFWFKEHTRKT